MKNGEKELAETKTEKAAAEGAVPPAPLRKLRQARAVLRRHATGPAGHRTDQKV